MPLSQTISIEAQDLRKIVGCNYSLLFGPDANNGLHAIVKDTIYDQYIAVGRAAGADAAIFTADPADLQTWTARANPKNFDLYALAYDPSLTVPTRAGVPVVVAVGAADGGDAYLIYSPTGGANWLEAANPQNETLWDVVFSEDVGLFVAVGTNGYIITSEDGATWTQRASPTGQDLRGVTYGNGYFVAVGLNGNVLRSSDGINWAITNSGIGAGAGLRRVYYLNSLFIATDTTDLYTSANGSSWAQRFDANDYGFGGGLGFGGGVSFDDMILLSGAGFVIASFNGTEWELFRLHIGQNHYLRDLAVENNVIIGVSNFNNDGSVYLSLNANLDV